MASNQEPPPLFENIDFEKKSDDANLDEFDDAEDLFTSALEEPSPLIETIQKETDTDDDNNKTADTKTATAAEINVETVSGGTLKQPEMETVPITSTTTNIISPLDEQLETSEQNGGDQFLDISVTDAQKIGDGMGAYVAYRVSTHTNIPTFHQRRFSVLRRFSDFLGLHDKLTEKYLRSGRIIPPAPDKSFIGMTKIKITNQSESGTSGGEFVEKRRTSLERYLRRTAAHPILSADVSFQEFLESDVELPKATSTSALSSAGVMRLFNKVGETVNKITYKMVETDPWFEDKIQEIDCLDVQLRKLHVCCDALGTHRRELGHLTGGVSKSISMLSSCEDHNSLSRVLAQLADVEDRVENLHLAQSNIDFYLLSELIKDYIGLLNAVKDAFHERTKVFQHWEHSQQMLTKRRENKAKLELNGGGGGGGGRNTTNEKLNQAAEEVLEWESKVERGQENFDKISKMIKLEMKRFEDCRIQDFKESLIKYLESHMEHQAQLINIWESFLPTAKSIA